MRGQISVYHFIMSGPQDISSCVYRDRRDPHTEFISVAKCMEPLKGADKGFLSCFNRAFLRYEVPVDAAFQVLGL